MSPWWRKTLLTLLEVALWIALGCLVGFILVID